LFAVLFGGAVALLPVAVEIVRHRLSMVTAGCPWVFESSARPGQPITDPKKAWQRACTLADVKDIRLHDLRRWYASALVSNGVSLQTVSRMLGHASPTVTALVYAHLSDASTRDALLRLPVPTSADKVPASGTAQVAS
jgi:integrase